MTYGKVDYNGYEGEVIYVEEDNLFYVVSHSFNTLIISEGETSGEAIDVFVGDVDSMILMRHKEDEERRTKRKKRLAKIYKSRRR